ncbi:MAG TPA: ABC transporter permease [Anaerolineaceae bacterium]|nr:ABC transporter permease [Anaerolineaceae bacterium]
MELEMSSNRNFYYDSDTVKTSFLNELREVFNFRNFIYQLARRDILTRYKRSVLGVIWTMLNPLGMMIIMTIAFSQLFNGVEKFPLYVLSGLVTWTFFSQTTVAAMVNLVWGGSLLNRIYMPRSSFAIAAIITGIVNILISLVTYLLMAIVLKVSLTFSILLIPVPIMIIAAFSLGIGLLLSTLAVYFPDVSEMYQIILTAWMYLTPIFYPTSIYPDNLAWALTHLNPMYLILNLFRAILYEMRIPTWSEIVLPLGIAIFVLVVGWVVFTRKADEFSYRI